MVPIRGDEPMEGPDYDAVDLCPVCGEESDYCSGHGEIGDYTGFMIQQQHDNDDHTNCNPRGCEEANQA